MTHTSADQYYHELLQKLELVHERLKQLSFRWSMARLTCFFSILMAVYFTLPYGTGVIVGTVVALIMVFLFLVKKQIEVDTDLQKLGFKIELVENEINILNDGQNTYFDGASFVDDKHPYTSDLDIFGNASLYHKINRGKTFHGIHTLAAECITIPDSSSTVNKRQKAIEELASLHELRFNYQVALYGIKNGQSQDPLVPIASAVKADLGGIDKLWISYLIKALPFIWGGLVALFIIGVPSVGNLTTGLFITNLFIAGYFSKKVKQLQANLARVYDVVDQFVEAEYVLVSINFKNEILAHHHDVITNSKAISSLKSIVGRLDLRLNMIMGVLLNGLLVWDLKMAQEFLEWRKTHFLNVPEYLQSIGDVEKIVGLATWSFHHEELALPTVTGSDFAFEAKQIFHPLMSRGKCVENDFNIASKTHLSIITGSNMAGKSTFLRTLGTNMILAYLGTKACAGSFQVSILQPFTYMRVKDTLEENVSTFKSEINRVQQMLELIKGEKPCLLLIDEMLRGTNSVDKLNGSMAIALKLLQSKTYALIATHDIKLTSLAEESADHVKNYFFDIEFLEGELAFDYKIKHGICTTFNAAYLLQQIGIDTTS